jgi:hypothetical protein
VGCRLVAEGDSQHTSSLHFDLSIHLLSLSRYSHFHCYFIITIKRKGQQEEEEKEEEKQRKERKRKKRKYRKQKRRKKVKNTYYR